MRETTLKCIEQERIIAILRGLAPDTCARAVEALYAGGIRLVEVTFQQNDPASFPETARAISSLVSAFEGRLLVGAGTVTTPELVDLAVQAGADYIIAPDVNIDVIHRTRELDRVSIPGAMTPSEILAAHRAGADYIKLFPAGVLGTAYCKAILAPLSHVKLLAVGGVHEKNAADFLDAGLCGVGVGGNLANLAWIRAGNYDKLTATARELVNAVRSWEQERSAEK